MKSNLLRVLAIAVASLNACAAGISTLHADVVLEWNAAIAAYAESRPRAGLTAFEETRAYAMGHLVMAEVLSDCAAQSHATGSSAVEAATALAQAAHDVLIVVLPEARDLFDARLASQLALRPAGPMRTRSIALGAGRARAFLLEHADALSPLHQYEAASAHTTAPLVLSGEKPLRAPAPDAPSMITERIHFDRARELQPLLDKQQFAARAALVAFWAENPSAIWNRAARDLMVRRGLPLHESARLFALLNAALADACILATDSRSHFGRIRTERRFLPQDDTSEILQGADVPAATWVTVQLPPLPNYPSVPATMSAAAARVLAGFFGDDRFAFTLTGPSASNGQPPGAARNYTRFSIAAKECALAGFCGGKDYHEACVAGFLHGTSIGKEIGKNLRFAKSRPAATALR